MSVEGQLSVTSAVCWFGFCGTSTKSNWLYTIMVEVIHHLLVQVFAI